IAVECFTKGLFPLSKPEGMEQGHAALEATLSRRCARISISNRAKLCGWGATVMCVGKRSRREQSEQKYQSSTHHRILHRHIEMLSHGSIAVTGQRPSASPRRWRSPDCCLRC